MATKSTCPCLAKAAPDEPIFTLRAQDKYAAETIRHWASLAQTGGSPPEKVAGALRDAEAMEAWAKEHGSKVPD